ncbi:MAG: STAS domain-containing protein [Mycobacteriaceae bacterium]
MKIEVTHNDKKVLIGLEGRFDAHEVQDFRSTLDPLLESGSWISADLSEVVFIDSSALAELVRARKRARAAEGEFIVSALSDSARVIFELTGLTAALTTARTDFGQ